MKPATLDCLAPLLAVLRANPALEGVRLTVFHLHGRDFVHFHEDPEGGVVADVRFAKGQIRMPVTTQQEQAALLERLEGTLAALERHSVHRSRKGARRSPDDG